jgi:hypothetical protein
MMFLSLLNAVKKKLNHTTVIVLVLPDFVGYSSGTFDSLAPAISHVGLACLFAPDISA